MPIFNKDCVEFMSTLDDKCIDLAILDPPYNVGAASWDKVGNYLEWMKSIIIETRRLLKDNGSFFFVGYIS